MRQDACHTAFGNGKLSFESRATARKAARRIGRQFDGCMKVTYLCPSSVGVRHFHLATRRSGK